MEGPAFAERGIDPLAPEFFWKHLRLALHDSARVRVYGASRKIGRSLRQLEDAWTFRVEDLGKDSRADSHGFNILLPKLGDAAPKLFEQPDLFGSIDPDDTVLDWFGDVANALGAEDTNSPLLDADILSRLGKFNGLTKHGIRQAQLETRRYRAKRFLSLNDALGSRAQSMVLANPAPRRTRIVGILDKVAYLDKVLLLQLADGAKLKVLWSSEDLEPIRALWGNKVMLGGVLQYRPNGTPQIFVAETVQRASEGTSIWDELPGSAEALYMVKNHGSLLPGELNPLTKLRGLLDGEIATSDFSEAVAEFCRS